MTLKMSYAKNLESTLYVDMEVDDFASFMFLKNVTNNVIELSLGGVENNKDLFCFFVDLLCKGLVLLFGKDNRLEVEDIKEEDFRLVMKKMSLAGIKVNLSIYKNDINAPVGVNIRELDMYSDNMSLVDFPFIVASKNFIYKIFFELISTH